MRAHRLERARTVDRDSLHHGGFRRVLGGHEHAGTACGAGGQGHGQRTANRPQVSLKPHFAERETVIEQIGFELSTRDQDGERRSASRALEPSFLMSAGARLTVIRLSGS